MDLNKHKEGFITYATRMFEEMAREGGFAMPGATLGVSVDDSVTLERLPTGLPETLEGFYKDLSGTVVVEVVSYSKDNGMVIVEHAGNVGDGEVGFIRTAMIDYQLFSTLFVKVQTVAKE